MRRRDLLRAGAGLLGTSAFAGPTAGAGEYGALGRVAIDGATEAVPGDDGTTAYVAATTGYATVDLSNPADPRVLAERRTPLAERENGPLREIHDVKVEGDRLLVVGPAHDRRDALAGVLVVDVADPGDPEAVAFHATEFPIHNCTLRDGRAYLTGNDGAGNPLVVLDAGSGEELGRWSLLDRDPAWGDVAPSLRTLHDVWVQDGVAYLALWDAGTWLLDVSDPAEPSVLGTAGGRPPADLTSLSGGAARRTSVEPPGNDHYAAVNDDATLLGVGKETWAASPDGDGGPSGIDLWDVSDPEAPTRLSRIDPPPTPDPTFDGVWTTAHNFELVGEHLYSAWYHGGVKRHDVSDPANPREETWWRDPERTRFWTARRAPGRDLFLAASMGTEAAAAALYAFPDRPGTGTGPGRTTLTPAGRTRTGAPPSPSASRTDPGTGGSRESDGDGTPSEAATETPDENGTGTAGGRSTDADAPGFGVGAAAAALGLLGWRHRRHRRR